MAGESVLAKMAVELSAKTTEFNKNIEQSNKILSGFEKSASGMDKVAKQLSGAITGIFSVAAVSQVASFVSEVSKLAGEAAGVRAAFDALPQSTRLMIDLKQATAGTVSELDLMKRSVQAANFGISLESLPKLLEFAAVRAQQTGQSVDYLVDSIVTGIGRKSPLILDNLGISAVALKEKMGDVSLATADVGTVAEAVGKIATEQLATMGSMVDTNATKTQRLTASWTNFKVAIGDAANGTGILGRSMDALSLSLDVASSKNLSFWEKLKAFTSGPAAISAYLQSISTDHEKAAEKTKEHERVVREIDRAYAEFGTNLEAYAKTIQNHVLKQQLLDEYTRRLNAGTKEEVKTLASLQESLKLLNDEFENLNINNKQQLHDTAKKIIAINQEIDALEKLRKAQVASQQMQTKFGRDILNQDGRRRGIGIDGTEAYTAPNVAPDPGSLSFQIEIKPPDMSAVTEHFNELKMLQEESGMWALMSTEQQVKALDALLDEQEKVRRQQEVIRDLAMDIGTAFGQMAADAITGNKNIGQAITQTVLRLLPTFLKMAIGGTIAGAAGTAAPPPVIVALAAAGVAAITAMFAKGTGYGGGGSGGSSVAKPAYSPTAQRTYSGGDEIRFDANFYLHGRELVANASNEGYRNERLG